MLFYATVPLGIFSNVIVKLQQIGHFETSSSSSQTFATDISQLTLIAPLAAFPPVHTRARARVQELERIAEGLNMTDEQQRAFMLKASMKKLSSSTTLPKRAPRDRVKEAVNDRVFASEKGFLQNSAVSRSHFRHWLRWLCLSLSVFPFALTLRFSRGNSPVRCAFLVFGRGLDQKQQRQEKNDTRVKDNNIHCG